jgi:hypothetical protein
LHNDLIKVKWKVYQAAQIVETLTVAIVPKDVPGVKKSLVRNVLLQDVLAEACQLIGII